MDEYQICKPRLHDSVLAGAEVWRCHDMALSSQSWLLGARPQDPRR